ncbi:MAG TPA: type II secretion system minor pseudopilin GspK [Burkholderiaceae bacterium]|nr:type II secretion system minor pseudopilin GspK [Burkholderiaceae bacterium]
MAIITALLLTTLAITIVASLFWQQQVQVRSIENQRLQLQKQWVLRGALDWARLILREDAKYSTVDQLGEPWAVQLAETRLDQYVENERAEGDIADATLSGHIIDAQSRFNLTNLAVNGVVDAAQVAVFQRLLSGLQLDPSLAPASAELVAAGQPKAAPATDAATAGAVAAGDTIGITQVDDLLAVPGFSPTIYAKLKDSVTVLPQATPVNANTASAEVLAAVIDTLSPADAAALVASRERAYFRDGADLAQRLPGGRLNGSGLVFATHFFLVDGKIRISRASLQMLALIERNGPNTKLIWIREN